MEKKYPIKWEYKSHSYQIGDTGDYDGYWEVTNGKDSLITKEDYDDIEKDLQAVVDLLNNTYANFIFNRDIEAALEAENKWLRHELEELKKQPGLVWVKASDLKIEYGKNYYAQWLDGKLKATGWFQESDGTFFWNVPGYIPIGKHEYERLSILDESALSVEREVAFAEWACLNYIPYYKGNELVAWKGYIADGDEIGLTTAQLYGIFKQQKEG